MIRSMITYHTLNLMLWVAGFGVIIWKAGWLPAVGLFLVLWANNWSVNAERHEARIAAQLDEEQAARELKHIRSDPQRFGDDPSRKRYM